MVKFSGRKEKGSRAERDFAKMLVESGLDPHASRMVMSGAIKGLESDIFTKIPINFEIKNQETWSPLAYYRQAQQELHIGSQRVPVVIMTKNLEGFYAFLSAQDFINMLVYATKAGWPHADLETPVEGFHPVPKPLRENTT